MFLTLITCPRTTLATSTHMVSPTARNTCQTPLPKANVRAITNSKVGIDQVTLISHIITLSIAPPQYPAKAPRLIPRINEIPTAITPTPSEIRVPIKIRLHKSRPNLSVPSKKRCSLIKCFSTSSKLFKVGKSDKLKYRLRSEERRVGKEGRYRTVT